jgi:hypothetical protein
MPTLQKLCTSIEFKSVKTLHDLHVVGLVEPERLENSFDLASSKSLLVHHRRVTLLDNKREYAFVSSLHKVYAIDGLDHF